MNKLQIEIDNLKKGCNIVYNNQMRCGKNYINELCPKCEIKLSQTIKCIEMFNEIIDELDDKSSVLENNEFKEGIGMAVVKLKQQLEVIGTDLKDFKHSQDGKV